MSVTPRTWWASLPAVLAVAAGCATIDAPVVNENYESPSRAQRRGQSDNAMNHVVHGEDPCADKQPARAASNRPAIETVVHARAGDTADECIVWGPGNLSRVKVRDDRAFGGLLGNEIAWIDEDGTLYSKELPWRNEGGEFRCGKLVIFGWLEDRIAARVDADGVTTTGLFSTHYTRAASCSDRQAALGAFAHIVLDQQAARNVGDDNLRVGPRIGPRAGDSARPR